MENNGRQGSHMYVLTLQNDGGHVCTLSGTFSPLAGWSRHDFYTQLRTDASRRYPSMASATVLYFSLDKNTL
ncbi:MULTISPECIES: hypothetical protein [Streptomyces]|uniref:Uncharacterized protein n=1 Tax=Streptomyces venezuelae TaxID=54571 RepID=A0A5P2AS12_STRVZ|nr:MULTISPECIES: hypothetical protein [Streptomyces]QES20973.1 hypothetical protein DEJ46_19195 [Streptomyces venezuelae]GGW02334.1 hypothetical protein GCM10010230_35140 [Streptomyces narbonensis]